MSARFCPECGAPAAENTKFCSHCGHALSPPPGATEQPPAKPKNNRLTLALIGVLTLGLILLTAGVVTAVLLLGDDDPTVVALEPVGGEVADPFTSSVSRAEVPLPVVTRDDLLGDATRIAGDRVGLYGGTLDQQSCDQEQLVDYLVAEGSREKAEAWADAQGLDVEEIDTFIEALTPVNLRRDTRVTNHGYVDRRANAYPAVLQAGTAVMVDDHGVPRAKCSCGNPLAEPADLDEVEYSGEEWDGFDAGLVVAVERADSAVSSFTLVDPAGREIARSVGADGVDAYRDGAGGTPGGGASESPSTPPPGDGGTGDGGTGDGPAGPQGTEAPVLAQIQSIQGTLNGPTAPSVVQLPAARITALQTYHWNNAQGATPGTIALRGPSGTTYGPFRATGSDGQGGVPNAYWTAVVDVEVPAGRYTVIDSDPATWSYAPDTGGRGMVMVWGVATSGAAASSDRSDDAIDAVRSRFCDGVAEYVARIDARRTTGDRYRVEVRIELDSGAWTATFEVDLSRTPARVVPVGPNSGELLC